MPNERQVYLLDPQETPPETIAVAFAKTSRSPQSFREIVYELNAEKSAEFHERWVVGYGHASVAEHAVLHIALENVSRLAVESIESNRLASYTEKSTRYQKWGAEDYFTPPELEGHPLRAAYDETLRRLFETYRLALEPVRAVIAERSPRREGESDAAFERRIRSDYVDVCRFLLPAASLANLGMTANARTLEHALRKMLSHPLEEVRAAGREMKAVALQRLPTLIKYVDAVPYWQEVDRALAVEAAPGNRHPSPDWCHMVWFDPQGEEKVLAAGLVRGGLGLDAALVRVRAADALERARLMDLLFAGRGPHQIPPRELELAAFTVELTIDQGGYFELKRHRMMTQIPGPLTASLGYAVPAAIEAAGLTGEYRRVMDAAARLYEKIADWNPAVASYVVPNGFNRRVVLHFNFRSADHLVSLRSAPNAHFSMRRAALRIADEIRAVAPGLGAYLRTEGGDTWQAVEQTHFADCGVG